jgi:hypothetical protein
MGIACELRLEGVSGVRQEFHPGLCFIGYFEADVPPAKEGGKGVLLRSKLALLWGAAIMLVTVLVSSEVALAIT